MTALDEMQFELLPTMTASNGVVFGIGADVSIDDGGFIPPDDDWQDQDQTNPSRGGTSFGRDLLNGPVWGWNLHVNQEDTDTAVTTLAQFKTAWRALAIRDTPGAVIPVRYRLNDRYRRFYGRPRRLSAPPDNKIMGGYIPITTDFKAVDAYTYDDVESSISLGLQGGSQGGFIFPAIFPLSTVSIGIQSGSAFALGDAPTYPVVRFNGPVTNPSLEADDWTLSLATTIPNGEYVEVDLRPWAMTALLNGSSSVAGSMGRRQYMSKMVLNPGQNPLTFRGTSAMSTATCTVRWNSAYNSY